MTKKIFFLKQHFKIGDNVELIFTQQQGKIIDFFDGETLIVAIEGDEIPVFVEHLKKITITQPIATLPQKNNFIREELHKQSVPTKKTTNIPPKVSYSDNKPDNGLHLLLQPFYKKEDGIIDYFLLHLHNDSGQKLSFNYTMRTRNNQSFDLSKSIDKRASMILNNLAYDDLNEQPEMTFEFKEPNKTGDYLIKVVKPKAKMLRKAAAYYDTINGNAYVYTIMHTWRKEKAQQVKEATEKKEKENPNKSIDYWLNLRLENRNIKEAFVFDEKNKTKAPISINAERRVIDLHADKLLPNYKSLRKSQLLNEQLAHFEKHLQEAIANHEPTMIAIHGLGKGKLKSSIVNILRSYNEVKGFKNEYMANYGFGATEITFDYTDNEK
mgnify:CR=1 FL=1